MLDFFAGITLTASHVLDLDTHQHRHTQTASVNTTRRWLYWSILSHVQPSSSVMMSPMPRAFVHVSVMSPMAQQPSPCYALLLEQRSFSAFDCFFTYALFLLDCFKHQVGCSNVTTMRPAGCSHRPFSGQLISGLIHAPFWPWTVLVTSLLRSSVYVNVFDWPSKSTLWLSLALYVAIIVYFVAVIDLPVMDRHVAIIVVPLLQLRGRSSIWSPSQFYSWDNTAIFLRSECTPTPTVQLFRQLKFDLKDILNYCHFIPVRVHDRSQAVEAGPSFSMSDGLCLTACWGSEGGPFNYLCSCTANSKVAVSPWLQTSVMIRRLRRATNRLKTKTVVKLMTTKAVDFNQFQLLIMIKKNALQVFEIVIFVKPAHSRTGPPGFSQAAQSAPVQCAMKLQNVYCCQSVLFGPVSHSHSGSCLKKKTI